MPSCKLSRKQKWQSGFEILKTLTIISKYMQRKEAENENMESALRKMDKLYSDIKLKFEDNLNRIKDNNYTFGSSLSKRSDLKDKPDTMDMQQEFISEVEIQDIKEQQQFVNERHQNLVELEKALSSIHNMSQKIYEIAQEDDIKIDTILKQQKQHKEVLETKINADIHRTAELNSNTCRKLIVFGFIALLIAIGVVYWCMSVSKKENPNEF